MRTETRTVFVRGVPARADLVEIQAKGPQPYLGNRPAQYLESLAAIAWEKMKAAAVADGIDLIAYSAFRSHLHQTMLYQQWLDGKRKLRPAKPGWSLHESGKAVDILRSHDDPDAGGPLVGPTDSWLATNAREFGFFRTVPKELWHFEHKGVT